MSQTNVHPITGWKSPPKMPPDTGWHMRLHDGTSVWIRPIDEQDAELELQFLNSLSPEFRRLRFLGLVRDPCPEVARELTDLDPGNAAGFIALISQEGRDRQIGAAHFHTDAKGDGCDCSVTVSEEWQKRGVGSSLMRRLVDVATARGLRHMRAQAPARSDGSHHLAARIGFRRRLDRHDPATVVYHLKLR